MMKNPASVAGLEIQLVPQGGIEPPTRGFSDLRYSLYDVSAVHGIPY
jgi:hypothetical protein